MRVARFGHKPTFAKASETTERISDIVRQVNRAGLACVAPVQLLFWLHAEKCPKPPSGTTELIMKRSVLSLMAGAILLTPPLVLADPDKDESGHGKRRHGHREYKEEYWDGNCKVERKWEKSGEYKEERKCKNRGPAYYGPAPAYGPAPVYVPAPQPGVVIEGTVRVN